MLHRLLFAAALFALPGISRASEESVAGLPQFDPTHFASQLFWLAILFVVVYVFMKTVGIPRVAAIVEERQRRIGGDLNEAERLRQSADETLKTYEATLADAHGKARKLLADTHERNVAALAEQTKTASAAFEKRVGEAVERIETQRADALKSIQDVARSLAAEITQKVSGKTPASDKVAAAVSRAGGA